MMEKLRWGLVVVTSVALGAAAVIGIDSLREDDPIPPATTTVIERVSAPENNAVSLNQEIDDLADLVESVRDSVVRIDSSDPSTFSGGTGSGVVLDKEGHILTNSHVVGNDTNVLRVTLLDGTVGTAVVVGRDVGNDLAVIKTDIATALLQPATVTRARSGSASRLSQSATRSPSRAPSPKASSAVLDARWSVVAAVRCAN